MKPLTIPKALRPQMRAFAVLSGQERRSMIEAISSVQASARLDKIAERIQSVVSLDDEAALGMADLLTSLYELYANIGGAPREFATAVVEAVQRMPEPPTIAASELVADLEQLPALSESLGLLSKARDVMTDHQRTWCHGRILTDLRPVFDSKDPRKINAAVVIHNLMIHHRGAEDSEFFVAMDRIDLLELQELIERALEKHKAIVERLGASVRILDQGDDL
jgi:hypothetical protein